MAGSFREKTSGMTVKEKIDYIWEYYKPAVIGGAVAFIIIVSLIIKLATPSKDTLLEVVTVNASPFTLEDSVFEDFISDAGYNPDEYRIYTSENYQVDMVSTSEQNVYSYQMLFARFIARDMDVFVADEKVFESFAGQNAFIPLSEYLTDEQLERYSDKLYSCENTDTGETTVCGIWIDGGFLYDNMLYSEPVLAGLPYGCSDMELSALFVEFLLDY